MRPVNVVRRNGSVRLRAILDALPIAVYVTDEKGRLTHFNSAAAEMAGRTPEIGTDQWCISWKLFHQDGTPMPHEQCPMAMALKQRHAVRGIEMIVEKPDGSRMHVAPHPTPLMDERGNLIGGVNLMLDISKAKQAAEATARLAAIVSSSDDAIISKTLNGIIQSWNEGAERIFGYSAAEAIGRPISIIIPPELLEEEATILARLRKGERIDHFDTVRVARNGRRVNISLTISPIRDDKGKIVGASKVARDISERITAEETLKATDRRKDEFLATLAHELRNPLAPLQNTLDILDLADDKPDIRKQAHATMNRQVGRLVRLVDDLMDVSRINQGKLHLCKEGVLLSELVQSAVEDVQGFIDEAEHELHVVLPGNQVRVHCDPLRMGQVLTNLLSNAVKYTPEGGQITVTAEADRNGVQLSVRDSGIGIEENKLERVFEMFGQLGGPQYDVEDGMGIGLTLVKSLVEAHGGTVQAASAGLGKGSEFTVWLPPPPTGVSTVETFPRKTESTGVQHAHRILVVDDNQDAAASLAMLLEMSGHEVCTAFDGHEALAVAEEFRPEFALIDIGLPGINGCDVARQIRTNDWGSDTILIAVTGWGQEADRLRTKAAGFDQHLTKPLTLERLHSLLRVLGKSRINRERVVQEHIK